MEVNARISGAWRKRMLFLFFMVFGIGAWFLSDGYIYWPAEGERHAEYLEIREGLSKSEELVAEDNPALIIAWEKYAAEKGYAKKFPKERTEAGIQEQRTIGWVMVGGSLLFLAWIAWNHTLRVTAEGEVVTGTNGKQVNLDSILKIDRKKWDNKGIAVAIYEEGGKERRLILDDHKFEGCEAIMLEAERRIKARKAAKKTEASES